MKLILTLLALFVATALGTPAEAGQANAVMQVRATVVESCSVRADTLEFVLGNAPGSRGQGQAKVALSCNGPAAYEVALDAGMNGGRQMIDHASGNAVSYEIYTDASRTNRWGNRLGIDTVSGTAGADGKAVLTAYGATMASADRLAAGTYSDAVVVTVNF